MTSAKPTLAVVGATGEVGSVLLRLLATRDDLWGEVRLIASARSAGTRLTVRGEEVEVVAIAPAHATQLQMRELALAKLRRRLQNQP